MVDLTQLEQVDLLSKVDTARALATMTERHGRFFSWRPLSGGLVAPDFQRKVLESKAKVRIFTGGNKVGKTETLIIDLLSRCTGWKPKALSPTGMPWRVPDLRGKQFLLGGEAWKTQIATTILPKLENYLTSEMLASAPKRNEHGLPYKFRFKSGAQLTIMSYDQRPEDWEGSNLHGVWFDEPPPHEIYTASYRGTLVTGGFISFWMTPLKEPWIKLELIDPAMEEAAKHADDDGYVPTIDYFNVPLEANCLEHCDGCIPHAEIEKAAANFPDRERQARMLGLFKDLQGIEFSEVDPKIHVVPNFTRPREWPIVEVMDPSYVRGFYGGWFTVSPEDEWFWFHAKHIEATGLNDLCREIQAVRDYIGKVPKRAIMDCRGGAQRANVETEEDWFDLFSRRGIRYTPSVETPYEVLHDWLRPETRPDKDQVTAKLRFTEDVARLKAGPIWAFQVFIWNREGSRSVEKYRQPGKDWIDLARYLSGFPNLTYRALAGGGDDLPRRPLSQSYATTPRVSRQTQRPMLRVTKRGNVARSYSTSHRRPGPLGYR